MMAPPVAELRSVTRVYDGAIPTVALSSASLELDEGDLMTIVGPSGSGKSTLLNLLGLLDRPSSGTVSLAGQETNNMSERQLAGLRAGVLGFVFQAFHLVPYKTVIENIEMGMVYLGVQPSERRRRACAAIDQLGMAHRGSAFPGTLSGGERQRVALARALANRPKLLLCDEPTGNLDSATSAEVIAILRSLNAEGQTTVIVTHEPAVARVGRRLVEVRDGVVTERAAVACD